VFNLFSTTLNRHSYCGVKYMSVYGEGWLQWRSSSWARVDHGPPEKIKKINDHGSILRDFYNIVSLLSFGWFKFPQSGVVAHPKNLNNSIIGLFCATLNNFSTVKFSGPLELFFLAPPLGGYGSTPLSSFFAGPI